VSQYDSAVLHKLLYLFGNPVQQYRASVSWHATKGDASEAFFVL